MRALVLDLLRKIPQPVNAQSIGQAVAEHLNLSEEQLAVREPGRDRAYVEWTSEWACNDLKHIGVCEQPGRGLYQLTDEGRMISHEEVARRHRERTQAYYAKKKAEAKASKQAESSDAEFEERLEDDWTHQLLTRLRSTSPSGFEELSAALLRVAGFDDVDVTGRSGDGGIDGIGVYRPSGLISFHTAFQCKRYQGSVGASTVRDFRGSFVGRADRGIIITTGYFTRDARDEAARPGANPVDLIDGEALCELLREHSLGVRTTTRVVEDIIIDDAYFNQFDAAEESS